MTIAGGAGPEPVPGGGVVNYKMARRAVLDEVRSGAKSQNDVCDAHPELIRAAVHHGDPTGEPCPFCDTALVHVSYVFGPRLGPGGRCVSGTKELDRLRGLKSDYTLYVVEVCPSCRWHHLDRAEII